MSDYGISSFGFKRKRLDLLLSELNSEMKSIFGDNLDVSPQSPDGQINGVISESHANLWELAEISYNAFDPNKATDATLSSLVTLNNIKRLQATYSTTDSMVFTGDVGALIPSGSLIRTSDTGYVFVLDEDVIINSIGEGYGSVTASETGPIVVVANTITEMDTPISGVSSVTNTKDVLVGTNVESDTELRARRKLSTARDSQGIIDSLFAGISNIPGVTKTVVEENDTDAYSSSGLPPNSTHVVVIGGSDQEIADMIWKKKSTGGPTYGSEKVTTIDSQGFPHVMKFSRPTIIDIYVEVDLTTFPDYPTDGDTLVKQAIVDYANGVLIEGRGFSLAQQVVQSRLYTPINTIIGHEIDAIRIGVSTNPTSSDNIPISATEMSRFLLENIVVNR